jgi:cyclomaltodextrinase
MTVPSWVADSVFYQIFPDRFANGDPTNDPPETLPWGSTPTIWDFHGGDLVGISHHFDHLLDLGISAIYLNPIFQSSSNHRYNTYDYFKIDPKLGDINDFKNLLDLAHRNNIRLILDGVFNHCGRGFFAFNDLLENEERSPYKDWFHISAFPLDAFSPGEAENYAAWWQIKSLPKFNTGNKDVRNYIFDVARYWIEFGVDGWRLDVPNEIDDDEFWQEFRYNVNSVNKDAYLLGEIWTAEPRWANGSHFDGLMNYPLRDALLRLLTTETHDIPNFSIKVEKLLNIYPMENTQSMYFPLGSHDTERIFTKLDCNIQKVKLSMLFQFAFPGAPAIYYGDEIGLQGGKDPDCRRSFPWERSSWNLELYYWVKTLVSLRKRLPALRSGDYIPLQSNHPEDFLVFSRNLGNDSVVILMNISENDLHLEIQVSPLGWEDGHQVVDQFTDQKFSVTGEVLSIFLPKRSGTWIT